MPSEELPECPLTSRQLQVVLLMTQGLSYKQIAVELGVAVSTVRSLVHNAMLATGLVGAGRGPLMALVLQENWMVPSIIRYAPRRQLRRGRDLSWRPSPAQRLYLTAFERLLVDRDEVAAAAMDLAFRLMCWEVGRGIPRPVAGVASAGERVDEMLSLMARGLLRQL